MVGSIWAMTWPFFTTLLKSAFRACTVPETWLPTWTVVTASSVPVAAMTLTMEPRVAVSVTICGAAGSRRAYTTAAVMVVMPTSAPATAILCFMAVCLRPT
jgi:hypothetical protein